MNYSKLSANGTNPPTALVSPSKQLQSRLATRLLGDLQGLPGRFGGRFRVAADEADVRKGAHGAGLFKRMKGNGMVYALIYGCE